MRQVALLVAFSALVLMARPAGADEFNALRQSIGEQQKSLEKAKAGYARMSGDFAHATTANQPAKLAYNRCKADIWAPVLATAFTKLDTIESTLEDKRTAIQVRADAALKTFKVRQNALQVADAKYYKKAHGLAYWQGISEAWVAIDTDYSDLLADEIVPDFDKYIQGLNGLTAAENDFATNCHSKVAKQLGLQLIDALNPVALIAAAIKVL